MLKEGERKLALKISQENGQVICTIDDNGIGRTKASEIKAQKIGAAHFESKGLKLSQQRIQLLEIQGQKGKVEIEDLYKDDVASGTRVVIHLPLINS
jgi:sensor histidine kinase regulating citrate/malate metabolism